MHDKYILSDYLCITLSYQYWKIKNQTFGKRKPPPLGLGGTGLRDQTRDYTYVWRNFRFILYKLDQLEVDKVLLLKLFFSLFMFLFLATGARGGDRGSDAIRPFLWREESPALARRSHQTLFLKLKLKVKVLVACIATAFPIEIQVEVIYLTSLYLLWLHSLHMYSSISVGASTFPSFRP